MKRNWEYKKLGDVCEILNGYAFKSQEYVDHGIRVIRITNVQKGHVIDDDPKFYPLTSESSLSNYMLVEDDLLMSLTGNVGRVGLLGKEFLPAALNQRVACLRIRSASIDKKFLFHILNSDKFEKDCIFNASGIAQKNMSTRWLGEYVIPVPPLEEQSRVVAELDLLTGIIDKQNAQLKELDNLAQAIFYDMFGDPIENEKGFELKTVGDLCTLKSGDSSANKSKGGSLPYVKVGDMNLPENATFITTSSTFVDRESNKKAIFPVGTIVFPKRGGAIFTNKKRLTSVEICCDLNTMGVIPGSRLTSQFVFHYFLGIDFSKICNGAAIPQLNNCDIGPLKIPVPPLALQQSFAEKIQSIEKQKETIRASIADTQKLLDYTMDKYFG